MNTLKVSIPDENFIRLRDTAKQFGISPEVLVKASLDDFLSRPDEDFENALRYVLNKNKELYRKLS